MKKSQMPNNWIVKKNKSTKNTRCLFLLLPSLALLLQPAAWAKSLPYGSEAENPCTKEESWSFSDKFPSGFKSAFKRTLNDSEKSMQSYLGAMALRGASNDPEFNTFSHYWVGRSYFQGNMLHLAIEGFEKALQAPISSGAMGAKLAAIECLNTLQQTVPTLKLGSETTAKLIRFPIQNLPQKKKVAVWDLAFYQFKKILSDEKSNAQAAALAKLLSGSGAPEYMARGLFLLNKKDYNAASLEFDRATKLVKISSPAFQKNASDLFLVAGRTFYTVKNYKRAAEEFKKVDEGSNLISPALTGLAWSYLMDKQYADSVGAASSVLSGGFAKTFSPEAPIIMAIAFAELCQYASSEKALKILRKNYKTSYQWLNKWQKSGGKEALYNTAVNYLRKGQAAAPHQVGSEFLRIPQFQGIQSELNALYDARSSIRNQLVHYQEFSAEHKERANNGKFGFLDDYGYNRKFNESAQAGHFFKSLSGWKKNLDTFYKESGSKESLLIGKLEGSLKSNASEMFKLISKVSDSDELIEVQTLNLASRDMLWQNLSEENKSFAKNLSAERASRKGKSPWSWDRGLALADANREVWEDDVFNLRAENLNNLCTAKKAAGEAKKNSKSVGTGQ